MAYGIIYHWHCTKTNMGYVGQTVNTLSGRWKGHRYAATRPQSQAGQWEFPKAIREHGVDSFVGRVICECETPEELDAAELKWVTELNTLWPNGYNMLPGGSGKDALTRQLISERTKAGMAKADPSWKDRQREAMSRPEVKQLISERTVAAMHEPERYAAFKEQMSSPERRAIVSELTAAAMRRPEVREKQLAGLASASDTIKTAHTDPKYRCKQSESKLRANQDPEYRQKISQRTREAMQRPEVRARMALRKKASP